MLGYSLRQIEEEDLPIVLKWRNSKHISKYMYTDNTITETEQRNWFNKLVNKSNTVYYILEHKTIPIGIVSFNEIDKNNNKCKWGFYIGEQDVPKGNGLILGYLGLDKAFSTYNIGKIIGEVFEFNVASIKLHQKLGFIEEGKYIKHVLKNGKYENVISFAMFKEDWLNNKNRIEKMIDMKVKESY